MEFQERHNELARVRDRRRGGATWMLAELHERVGRLRESQIVRFLHFCLLRTLNTNRNFILADAQYLFCLPFSRFCCL